MVLLYALGGFAIKRQSHTASPGFYVKGFALTFSAITLHFGRLFLAYLFHSHRLMDVYQIITWLGWDSRVH